MKRDSLLLLIWCIVALLGGWIVVFVIVLNSIFQSRNDNNDNNYDGKLAQVLYYIQTLYVDEVDARRLAEVGIRAMTDKLDRHSQLLEAAPARALEEQMQGGRDAIGVSLYFFSDTAFVLDVVFGSPAQKAGIMPGDRIIYINETLVAGVNKNSRDTENSLRISRGSSINIKTQRRGIPDLLNFHIEHGRTPVFSVLAAYMITEDVGYIRLNSFSATTIEEFQTATKELQQQGMQHLILDLINNAGGLEKVSVAISSEFLEENKTILYRQERNNRVVQNAQSGGGMLEGRVVVLINEATASGSETVAGALQDWDRGVIVGRQTLGKGTGQSQFSFPDGRRLNLTTSRGYTPSGRSIEQGVSNDTIDTQRFFTLRNNREVQGGGITPDYNVPTDVRTTPLFRSLLGVFDLFARLQAAQNAQRLLYQYPTVTALKHNFQVTSNMIDILINLAAASNIEWNNEQFEQSRSLIYNRLKADMASYLFGYNGFFQIYYAENAVFQAGLRIISNPEEHERLLSGVERETTIEQTTDE